MLSWAPAQAWLTHTCSLKDHEFEASLGHVARDCRGEMKGRREKRFQLPDVSKDTDSGV